MNDVPTSGPPAQDPSGQVASGARRGGRLVRRTFLIALALVCGGLLTSGGVELLFRYRESVEAIGALQREMAQLSFSTRRASPKRKSPNLRGKAPTL